MVYKTRTNQNLPRISTRGYYDLSTGITLKKKNYFLYPDKFFKKLQTKKEFVIMIHGLRNNSQGAVSKFKIAKNQLKKIGYSFPVVGFSYDSNTKGAHLKKSESQALKVGNIIAKKNGKNLCKFILDFKKQNSQIKIRLMGHSLGSQVILSALEHLFKHSTSIESVYFFGASIPNNIIILPKYKKIIQKTVLSKIVNYYSPEDEVLKYANDCGLVENPIGFHGVKGKAPTNMKQKKVYPENHRFASYAKTITKFP